MQDRHECPLVQALVRRVRNLGIDDVPACVDRELDKYRSVARVLNCPLLANLSYASIATASCSVSQITSPSSANVGMR
jgi:hypothetical protein